MRTVRLLAFALLTLLPGPKSRADADISLEYILHAKQATALVDVEEEDGIGEGSAFCIDASGLFVTNAHVVEDLKPGGKLMVVLHSGEKDQAKLAARVLKMDKELDLAVLQVSRTRGLSVMALGNSEGLVETMPIAAFGYPFGSELAIKEGDFPAITVSTGHVTSLRKSKGFLVAIQVDASLNPGNSGGPIINSKGEVIAIVREGIPGSGINLAIPVNVLRIVLSEMSIVFTPPDVMPGHMSDPQEFRIQLLAPPQGSEKVSISLTLGAGTSDERSLRAETTDGRTFTVTTPIISARRGSGDIKLTAKNGDSSVTGHAPDTRITVGDSTSALSRVRRIKMPPDPEVILIDDRVLKGEIGGLPQIDVVIGGRHAKYNMKDFDSILVESSAEPDAVTYQIRATQGNRVLGELKGSISAGHTTAGNSVASSSPGRTGAVPSTPVAPVTKTRTPGFEILVSCLDSNDIRRFDVGTGEFLGIFASGNGLKGPQDMQWGPDGNLYVCSSYNNSVCRFDGKTGKPMNPFVEEGSGGLASAYGMAWGPDGNLYISSFLSKEVKRYNGKTGSYMGNFIEADAGGLDRPTGLRFGPDGNLYVASFTGNLIKRYNGHTGAFIADFANEPTLKAPGAIEFGPDGMLYVCSTASHEVMLFNGKSGAFVESLVKPHSGDLDCPSGILFGADGKLYVDDKTSQIKRFDAKTGAYIEVFASGSGMVDPGRMVFRGKPTVH